MELANMGEQMVFKFGVLEGYGVGIDGHEVAVVDGHDDWHVFGSFEMVLKNRLGTF